jgi:hypothetical protein|tara:strand:- start:6619 stop:7347 length:729 start_codon:yes stop_codon:yes gene_type:complete
MSRLRANQITNKTANGAPTATNGFIVTGVCTATSFVGSGTALTGIDAATLKFGSDTKAQAVSGGVNITGNLGVSGVLTYEDVTNVDSVGLITARAGINLIGNDLNVGSNIKLGNASGIVTASSYRGDGSQLTGISVGIATEASTVTDGNTVVLNLAKDDHKVLASGVVTIDVTGGTEADSHTVRIENVGVATVGFATHFLFPSGGTPALPTTSGAISIISFTVHKAGAAGTSLLTGVSVNFS